MSTEPTVSTPSWEELATQPTRAQIRSALIPVMTDFWGVPPTALAPNFAVVRRFSAVALPLGSALTLGMLFATQGFLTLNSLGSIDAFGVLLGLCAIVALTLGTLRAADALRGPAVRKALTYRDLLNYATDTARFYSCPLGALQEVLARAGPEQNFTEAYLVLAKLRGEL